jgi:hypothetical protein
MRAAVTVGLALLAAVPAQAQAELRPTAQRPVVAVDRVELLDLRATEHVQRTRIDRAVRADLSRVDASCRPVVDVRSPGPEQLPTPMSEWRDAVPSWAVRGRVEQRVDGVRAVLGTQAATVLVPAVGRAFMAGPVRPRAVLRQALRTLMDRICTAHRDFVAVAQVMQLDRQLGEIGAAVAGRWMVRDDLNRAASLGYLIDGPTPFQIALATNTGGLPVEVRPATATSGLPPYVPPASSGRPDWRDGPPSCPRSGGDLARRARFRVGAPAQHLLPAGVVRAVVCLYTRGRPSVPAGFENGRALVASGEFPDERLLALLAALEALPVPTGEVACTDDGRNDALDGLILVDASGSTFPVLLAPRTLRPGENPACGAVQTPAGGRVLGDDLTQTRVLFGALGLRAPL